MLVQLQSSSSVPPLQLPILASSVVSLYFLELTDIFQPVHSGYSCNDRSLSLPYILPRQEVCPLPLLFSLAFAAPTATVSEPSTFTFDFGSPKESLWFCWASPVSICLKAGRWGTQTYRMKINKAAFPGVTLLWSCVHRFWLGRLFFTVTSPGGPQVHRPRLTSMLLAVISTPTFAGRFAL